MSACHGTKSKFGKIQENWENLGKSGKINDILGKKTTFWENVGKIWEKKNILTIKDFLEWYNNLDDLPFVEAVEKMKDFYKLKDLIYLKLVFHYQVQY